MKQKFLAPPALLIALVLFSQFLQAQVTPDNRKEDLPKSLNVQSIKTDGSDETEMNYTSEGHRYQVRLKGNKITELYVDNKKIAESDFVNYEPGIRKILDDMEENRRQAAMHRVEAEKHRAEAEKHRAEAEKHRVEATKLREEMNKLREQAGKNREQAEKHRAQADKARERASKQREQAERERDRANVQRKEAEKGRARAEVERKKAGEERQQIEAMFDELVTDQLITERGSLTSLELDETRLVINGKEQAAAVHQRYKEKYLKGKHKRIQYSNSGGSQTMTIN